MDLAINRHGHRFLDHEFTNSEEIEMQHVPSNFTDEEVLHVIENTPVLIEVPLVKELCDRFWLTLEMPDVRYSEDEMDEV